MQISPDYTNSHLFHDSVVYRTTEYTTSISTPSFVAGTDSTAWKLTKFIGVDNPADSPTWLSHICLLILLCIILPLRLAVTFAGSETISVIAQEAVTVKAEYGEAKIVRDMDGSIVRVASGEILSLQMGDMVSAESGIVTLQYFEDKKTILKPGARITIEKLIRTRQRTQVEIALWVGTARHENLSPKREDIFQINTPHSVATLNWASLTTDVGRGGRTFYMVHRGTARIVTREQDLLMKAGHRVIASPNQSLFSEK